ncbi:MAG: isocitrate lyase/phosphoenolpyruvate mutase family protein [Thermoanaerobaculia bacterium]|nr:isocitrate lyase/phosphoenolpyruvate mutase family protein [Thermoanaerobaculia bacterium]
MTSQADRARTFHSLHVPGDPVVLFNVWDAGSAKTVARAGAKAIATGSWSVAAAHGHEDGEELPLDLALANLERIVAAVDLPVTIDLESGYGRLPEAVGETAVRAIASGAIGFNLEDRVIGEKGLYSIEDQSARIRAARSAADRAAVLVFINARTDVFLKADPATHEVAHAEEALRRAAAYAVAGASGLFVPGLVNEELIERVCKTSPLPVNVMVHAATPPASRLMELGVARISYGPGPYRESLRVLEEAARKSFRSPGN